MEAKEVTTDQLQDVIAALREKLAQGPDRIDIFEWEHEEDHGACPVPAMQRWDVRAVCDCDPDDPDEPTGDPPWDYLDPDGDPRPIDTLRCAAYNSVLPMLDAAEEQLNLLDDLKDRDGWGQDTFQFTIDRILETVAAMLRPYAEAFGVEWPE